uniref:Uncharacterized protein n=1 Tax=Aegilops tauschii subsp. strangulata TaxID=200361 RepID=A0A453DXN0_AEGTS
MSTKNTRFPPPSSGSKPDSVMWLVRQGSIWLMASQRGIQLLPGSCPPQLQLPSA